MIKFMLDNGFSPVVFDEEWIFGESNAAQSMTGAAEEHKTGG
jgi:hypothetical protein